MVSIQRALYNDGLNPAALEKEALAALSTMIDCLNCTPTLANYCRRYGVLYLGEACRLNFASARDISEDREELGGLLNQLGLSFGNDPIALGWQPPYWKDAEWRVFLDTPLFNVVQLTQTGKKLYGVISTSSVGELIMGFAKLRPTDWMWFQVDYGRKLFPRLRAGMVVPTDWRPGAVVQRAHAFGTMQECRDQVAIALRAHTSLMGAELERVTGELATIVQRVGAKVLSTVVSDVVGKLPLAESAKTP